LSVACAIARICPACSGAERHRRLDVLDLTEAPQCLDVLAQIGECKAGIPVTAAWIPLQSALHWLVVTVPRDCRRRTGLDTNEALCRRIGEVVFGTKAGGVIPKLIVLNDDIDPTNLKELVWAFATRCHPLLGHVVFDHIPAAPLLAYLRDDEKIAATTGKIAYNCLPPDEWGEALPIRASFRHGYPPEIVDRVRRRWSEYGFRSCQWAE
jgi:4-hydroxy-3-polyprenylbenzoate decarboxylase